MISSSCLRFNVVHVNAIVTYRSLMRFCIGKFSLVFGFCLMLFGILPESVAASILPSSMTSPGNRDKVETGSADVSAAVVDPNLTVRFNNPQFSCSTYEYCLDVEFQSDIANKELFGMNVRFFIDDKILEYVNLKGFQGGYGAVSPSPANVNYSTSGIPWFNFTDGADYVNGAVQKTNSSAPAIYISTSGWTKLFQACFTVDYHNGSETVFCPPIVWDLEADPNNGGFPSGSAGVVMTVVNGSGSSNAFEHVNQFNWQYTGNGSAPFGEPIEISCINIDCGTCTKVVTSNADAGANTLRAACQCAYSGDTITFGTGMAGATITISSTKFTLSKTLYIRSNLSPPVKITSSIAGLFEILTNTIVEFKDLEITSGLLVTNNLGAAFRNDGTLRFINVKVFKNPNLATGQFLIRNRPGSSFSSMGSCYVEIP